MNIPVYRAKKIDSDEYVIGYYSPAYDIHHYIITHLGVDTKVDVVYQMSTDIHKIDPTTLAIHFPDMLDSEGNKIFASLSEDVKGGDRIIESGKYEDGFNPVFEPYFRKSSFSIYDLPKTRYGEYKLRQYKVIGIQE